MKHCLQLYLSIYLGIDANHKPFLIPVRLTYTRRRAKKGVHVNNEKGSVGGEEQGSQRGERREVQTLGAFTLNFIIDAVWPGM